MPDPIRYKKKSFIPKFAKQSRAIKRISKKDTEHVVNNTLERRELYKELKKYSKGGVTEEETRRALSRLKYRKKAESGRRHLSRKEMTKLAKEMGVEGVDYKHFIRAKKFEEKRAAQNTKKAPAETIAKKVSTKQEAEKRMPDLHAKATKSEKPSRADRAREMRINQAKERSSRHGASVKSHTADRSRFKSKYARGSNAQKRSSTINNAHNRANFGARTTGNAHVAVRRMNLH